MTERPVEKSLLLLVFGNTFVHIVLWAGLLNFYFNSSWHNQFHLVSDVQL